MSDIKSANNYGSLARRGSYDSLSSNDSLDSSFVDKFLRSDSEGLSGLNPLATSDGQPTSSAALEYKRFLFFGKKVELNLGKTANWTLRKAYNSVTGAPGKVWRNLPSFCSWSSLKLERSFGSESGSNNIDSKRQHDWLLALTDCDLETLVRDLNNDVTVSVRAKAYINRPAQDWKNVGSDDAHSVQKENAKNELISYIEIHCSSQINFRIELDNESQFKK